MWPCRTDLFGNGNVEPTGSVDNVIGLDITSQLAAFADRMGTTPRTVALAALRVLLSRHVRQSAFLIGTPPEKAADLGLSSLCWRRVDVSSHSSFASLVCAEHAGAASGGQSVARPSPDAEIAAAARLPVGQVVFLWRDEKGGSDLPGATADPLTLPACPAPYELVVELQGHRRTGLVASWHYAVGALDRATVTELAGRYVVLLGSALSQPEQPLNVLPALTSADRERLVAAAELYATPCGQEGQDNRSVAWAGETVVDMIAAQVAAAPGATALSAGETSISYAELWARSGDVATELVTSGVRSEEPVGVLLARGLDMVIALLGVLRAGACCLPLDPAQPAGRLALLLADSGARVLLTDDSAGKIPGAAGLVACRVQDLPVTRDVTGLDGVARHLGGLAYLLYTSGTTGTPKGVGVTHAGLANCLHASRAVLECRPGQRLLAISTVTFDIAALELLLMLISGAETVVASAAEQRNGELLRSALARCRPDYLQATPISLRMLFVCGWEGDPELTVSCGGDVVDPALAARLAACTKRLWHTYGPTEASLYSVTQTLPAGPQPPIVPIGVRLSGTYTRILDSRLSEVAPGDIGELCIGGVGLARGYLGLPGLTARQFVPDPFAVGARLYRTGDLARQRRDGRLELHGRADCQVKIRGHRIEPGEIEAVLGRHPDVAVVAIEIAGNTPDGRRIEAYVQPTEAAARRMVSGTDGGAELSGAITGFSETQLPAHMRPAVVRVVESMPVNLRGKVDRQALRVPQAPDPRPPRSGTDADELAIATAFSSVLGRPAETSDFTEGGDLSLMAEVRLKLRDWYGADIDITDLAAAASLRELALALRLNRIRGHLPVDAATGCRWIRRGRTLPALVLVGVEPVAESYRALLGQIEETRPVALADASRIRPELAANALLVELGAGVSRGIVFAGHGAGTDVALALATAAERAVGHRYPVAVIGGPVPQAGIGYRGQVMYITTRQSAGHLDAWRVQGRRVSVVTIPGDASAVLGPEGSARIAGLLAGLA